MLERAFAHRAGGDHHVGVRCRQIVEGRVAENGLLFKSDDRVAKVHTAAEALLLLVFSLQQGGHGFQHVARLLVDTATASQLARIVVGDLQVALADVQFTRLDELVEIFGVVIHRDMQLVFVLEGIVADRAGGDERGGAGAVDEFRVLAAQFSCLLVKSLLPQRNGRQ